MNPHLELVKARVRQDKLARRLEQYPRRLRLAVERDIARNQKHIKQLERKLP